jgi:uncharacterized protein (TIGR04255 family)
VADSARITVYQVINSRVLPSYERPPVQEVALGVQFHAQNPIKTTDLAGFWEAVRERFSVVDDLQPVIEMQERQDPRIELLQLPPLRRIRMREPAGELSIQLQGNHFITNWVKPSPDATYPRFAKISAEFETYFTRLREFVASSALGAITPTSLELTYVNELGTADSEFVSRLPQMLKMYTWQSDAEPFLGKPTAVNLMWQFPMPLGSGRMLVTLNNARRVDGAAEVLLLILKCFSPTDGTPSEISGWFASAHESIVRTFTELTTPEAHLYWGRIE